jgi:hypothetical protein
LAFSGPKTNSPKPSSKIALNEELLSDSDYDDDDDLNDSLVSDSEWDSPTVLSPLRV